MRKGIHVNITCKILVVDVRPAREKDGCRSVREAVLYRVIPSRLTSVFKGLGIRRLGHCECLEEVKRSR